MLELGLSRSNTRDTITRSVHNYTPVYREVAVDAPDRPILPERKHTLVEQQKNSASREFHLQTIMDVEKPGKIDTWSGAMPPAQTRGWGDPASLQSSLRELTPQDNAACQAAGGRVEGAGSEARLWKLPHRLLLPGLSGPWTGSVRLLEQAARVQAGRAPQTPQIHGLVENCRHFGQDIRQYQCMMCDFPV